MRKQKRPEEIPDLREKCEKYGITYERACWLLTCPVIDFTATRPKRIIRNMQEYGENHHISRSRDMGCYYLKLKIGNFKYSQRLTMDIVESRALRDKVIEDFQRRLEAGELDSYFIPQQD